MAKFIAHNNKILVDSLGRLKIPAEIPKLEFDFNGTTFPNGIFQFRLPNVGAYSKIFIDYGDGSPIYEKLIDGTYIFGGERYFQASTFPDVIHNYPNTNIKKIKVWFEKPENVQFLNMNSPNFVGEFPLVLGLYKFNDLRFGNTKFTNFPTQLSGGVFLYLELNNITLSPINYIPKWIYYSKISILSLLGGFNLSDLSVSNFDKLINIQGLASLYLFGTSANASNIPNNLKDISTLRFISFGDNTISEIPTQFNNCKQITELALGYRVGNINGQNPNLTSWGVGIADMPNLKTFSAQACINIPTDIVTGIETSGINNYLTFGSYKTTARVDASILSAYNKVNSLASKTVGNTLLRNIIWVNGMANPSIWNSKPTGVYQAPSGFVLGSNNGTPANAMEMIYVLTKQYRWTITINLTNTTVQTYNYLS